MSLWPFLAALVRAVLPICADTCPQRPQPPQPRGMRRATPPACRPAALGLPCHSLDRNARPTDCQLHLRAAQPRSVVHTQLTLSLASTLAPRFSRSSTMFLWPPAAALVSALLPFCDAACPQRPQPPPCGMRRAPPPAYCTAAQGLPHRSPKSHRGLRPARLACTRSALEAASASPSSPGP